MKNLLDPTPRFDSHISKNASKVTSLNSYRAFELTQVNTLKHRGEKKNWEMDNLLWDKHNVPHILHTFYLFNTENCFSALRCFIVNRSLSVGSGGVIGVRFVFGRNWMSEFNFKNNIQRGLCGNDSAVEKADLKLHVCQYVFFVLNWTKWHEKYLSASDGLFAKTGFLVKMFLFDDQIFSFHICTRTDLKNKFSMVGLGLIFNVCVNFISWVSVVWNGTGWLYTHTNNSCSIWLWLLWLPPHFVKNLSHPCIHPSVLGGSLPTCLHYLWIPKPFAHWYKCATKISLKTLKPPQLAPFIMEKQPQYAEQLPKEHREVLRLEKEAHLVCLWSHFGPLSNFVFLCLCLENKNQFYLLMRICCQR